MFCGYLRQTCKGITIKELIDILSLCKNKDAKIKLYGVDSFYIHFDQDCQFINFDKSSLKQNYGNCQNCHRYNKDTNFCKCDGKDCLNANNMIDTEKYNNIHFRDDKSSTDSKNQVSREDILEAKRKFHDLINKNDNVNLQVNGIDIKNKEEPKTEFKVDNIQNYIDDAVVATLNKMINGIKEKK